MKELKFEVNVGFLNDINVDEVFINISRDIECIIETAVKSQYDCFVGAVCKSEMEEQDMRIRLINALDFSIMDQFTLNKSLEESIKYLKSKYDGEIVCEKGMLSCYVRHVRGV